MNTSCGWTRLAAAALLAGALGACDRLPGMGGKNRRPAVLEHHGDRSTLEAPAKAKVGVPFTAKFVVYGTGCLEAAPAESVIHRGGVDIRPYQLERKPSESEACPMNLRMDDQNVSIAFPLAGKITLRVIGRREPGDGEVTLERTVEVAP